MTHAARTFLWPAILAVAAVGGSWVFACIAPFAALGALAQRSMSLPQALTTVALAWSANQIVGYGLLDYPVDAYSLSWGATLLFGALVGTGAARLVDRRAGLLSLGLGFVAAFCWYEASMAAMSLLIGGIEMFGWTIVRQVLVVDLAFFAGLTAMWLALRRATPALFGGRPALAA